MRDFNPHRIASQWHSGQGSALYAYSSTDRIPNETFKDRLVWEIEQSMAAADDDGLDELEMLLMHVEEQHPGDEMREAGGMTCEACGGMTTEGTCECAMAEAEREPSTYDYEDNGMSLDAKRSAAAERGRRDARPYQDFSKPNADRQDESTLRAAIQSILSEMKLSIAGTNPFGFGAAEELDDEDIAHFLLSKKDVNKDVPAPPKSGVKAKAKPAKRKSKKVR